jgi:hypothetical protein
MATSGAYYNTAFNFTYAIAKASDPTVFFTGTFTAGEVKVSKRTGSGPITTANIATLPVPGSSGLMNIALADHEMQADEITIEFIPSAGDFGARAVSITTEPTPSDILEVASSTVSGVADFKATGFSTFNPATDTVANVTTVGSVSGSVGSVVASVTAGTVTDKSGYFISGSLTTLDALENIAATDIVSAGPITTLSGAVVNVDTVDTNFDMRGTDNAATQTSVNTIDTEVGQIKAKTDQLTFTVANQVDANALTGGGGDATAANQSTIITHLTDVKGTSFVKDTHSLTDITADVTGLNGAAMRGTDGAYTGTPPTEAQIYAEFATGTNPNPFKADVSGLSTFNAVTDTVSVGDKTGFALSSAANDAIGAAFLAYTLTKGSPGTIERAFWQALKTQALTDGEVSGSPTASEFDTNLTAVTGAYDHLLLMFTSGSLEGEARPISTYNNTNGRVVLQDPLTAAPSAADEFIIVPDHTTPDNEIADAILSRNVSNVEVGLGEHTLGTIVLCILESVRSGTTWTIKRSDSTTTHVTKTLTLDASAQPVIGVD